MYNNVAKKIKTAAKILPYLLAVISVFVLIILECSDMNAFLFGSIGALIGIMIVSIALMFSLGYILGLFIYGFADIIEKINDLSINSEK